jgi:glyoxylase-like metal-dependent hydrolase (beta-lactamase superfamily II)
MTVETFALGALGTNAYVIGDEGSPDCWVFDCPDGPGPLIEALRSRGALPRGLFLTHAHSDHIAGLDEFRRSFPGVPVHQHALETPWLGDPQANLSAWMGPPVTVAPADVLVADGQRLVLGARTVQALHLPGHSPGSLAWWFETEGEVIVGDVLFRSGVGRWDFPGSDGRVLRKSLERLCGLPDATRVRPGHGPSTTIGREKASNPYLRSDEPWRDG